MNIKKLFATLSAMVVAVTMSMPSVTVFGANYSEELQGAYNWAHDKGVTTMSTIDNANMYGAITRAEMAKMLSVYATTVLEPAKKADTSKACTFTDIDSVKGDLHDYIIESCQLGIMGQNITAFRPYDTISRAEFGTALSRLLYGSKYEGGTPYYANHLQALKADGIMNQIANAESTKEVRGYVMLMLQRSDEGAAGTVEESEKLVACLEKCGSDTACVGECYLEEGEEDNTANEDEVVKSGSLAVTAESADSKVFIGRASDLDILTFKTSEEVELSKVVLERYGYSTPKNVYRVWLEDENGTVISNQTDLDNKGQAKLTIKKDYRKVDGELNATIVLWAEAENPLAAGTPEHAGYTITNPGATFGFKVVDVTSTAENVDLPSKNPATYEAIAYDGSTVTLTSRGSATVKQYNFEAGKMYEVAKFKIQTPDDSAIKVKGFTFENDNSNAALTKLDLHKYFDEAEVTIGGEKVSGLNAEANKNGELVISFKDFEIAAKSKADVVVKISLTDDFDTFNNGVLLQLTEFNAIDSKVSSRVKLVPITYTNNIATNPAIEYQFRGGKVKLANVKLGNVDASQNAEDIVVAEGTIEVPEALKGTFSIVADGKGAGAIKQLTFVVKGDDYDANTATLTDIDGVVAGGGALPAYAAFNPATAYALGDYVTHDGAMYKCTNAGAAAWNAANWSLVTTKYTFTFNNVEIEESGKIRFLVDINDYASWNGQTINFSTFKFAEAGDVLDYDESQGSALGDIAGSISFSKVTIQASKASLKNNLTKDVEFPNKLTRTEVVFDGTYTAKKGDIKLNEFSLAESTATACVANNDITFYVYIDGVLVADEDATTVAGTCTATDTFDDVLVKAGESVSIKVEAEVDADNATPFTSQALGKYTVTVRGDDENGNPNSGNGSANTVSMKVVDKGSATVSTSATKQTVLRKASNAKIAEFIIKPANGASSLDLEEIAFDISGIAPTTTDDKITVEVDGIDEDDFNYSAPTLTYAMNREVKSEGVVVTITLDDEVAGTVEITNLYINGKKQTKTFSKMFADAAVWVKSQSASNGATTFVLGVDKDSDVTVKNFTVYYNSTNKALEKEFDDGDKLSVNGTDGTPYDVDGVSYLYSNGYVFTDADISGETEDTASTAGDTCEKDGVPKVGWTAGTHTVNECEYEVVKIKKASTPNTPAGGTILPDYFKVGENEDDLRVVYKM